MRVKPAWIAWIAIILFQACFGQTGEVEVKLWTDRDTISIGDELEFKVTVTYNHLLRLDSLKASQKLGKFEVKNFQVLKAQKKKNRISQSFLWKLTIFDLGEFVIPPIPLVLRDPFGIQRQIKTEEKRIYVKSIGAVQQASDIKGLKPPLKLREIPWFWIVSFIIISALAITSYFLKRRKKLIFEEKVLPVKPAWAEALEKLEQLKNSDWIEKGKIKEYYLELSEIMKVYLEKNFQLPVVDRTTMEIRSELRKKPDLAFDIYQEITVLLEDSDLVKFAKLIPIESQIDKNLSGAFKIVEQTRPKVEVQISKTTEVN